MKINELINNKEFSFNPHFKIYRYEPPDVSSEEEGECILIYDSFEDKDLDPYYGAQDISAINQANDGTVEIEYMECWL